MNLNRINQLAGLTIMRPIATTKTKNRQWIPAGPKTKPINDHPTRYLETFIAIIAEMIYEDRLSLKQIADTLNMAGLTTSTGKTWKASYVDSAIRTQQGWAIIEPLWNNWSALNADYVPNVGRPQTKIKETHITFAPGHADCALCEMADM